ncbi:hypothetical protein Ancab_005984 [Ancistrocladus abbreviatus]
MEGKVENEKPRTSAFSLCPAQPVSPTPNTKVAHTSHGKAGALRKCQTLHGSSSPFLTDRGTTYFQSGEELGPDGPSGLVDLPQPKGDGPNSFVGHFSGLRGSSIDRPRISPNANQSCCPTLPLCFGPCSRNNEPQNSLITDTSKTEYRSNELSSITHISKPPYLSYSDICKRPHRATSKRKSINHLTKLIHGPLSLKARSRKQKKRQGSTAKSVRDEIQDEASIEANTVDKSQFQNMNRIVAANEEKRSLWTKVVLSLYGDQLNRFSSLESSPISSSRTSKWWRRLLKLNHCFKDNRGWLNSCLCTKSGTASLTYTVKKAYGLLTNALNEPKDSRSQLI